MSLFSLITQMILSLSLILAPPPKTLLLGNTPIRLEIAETQPKRILGLSGRASLPDSNGMFFIFPQSGKHGIWMKDMRFPIDIFWLDGSYKVVDLKKDASPKSFPKVFWPKSDAKYVLEVNSGLSDSQNIKIGDRLNN